MSIDRTARLHPDSLFVSEINPRMVRARAPQEDLVASIRQHGILVPLLVRPCEDGRYEVVAGSRRLAAAQEIGLPDVPCIIRSCDDAEARALALVDNLQREDVHPLEEAEGYAALLGPSSDISILAAQVGRSVTYIRRRLALRQLVPPVAEACRAGEITVAHAEELARLAPDVQPKAFEEGCFDQVLDYDALESRDVRRIGDVRRRELKPLRRLKQWIREHTKIDITQPETIALFPQLAELPPAEAPLEISTALYAGKDVPPGVLPHSKWRNAEAKREQCEHRQRAVVVHDGVGGPGLGQIRWVCAHRKCAKHFPQKPRVSARAAAGEDARPSWEQQEAQRRRDQAAYDRLLAAAVTALAEKTRDLPLTDAALVRLLQETTADDELRRVTALVGGAITLKTLGQALVLIDALGQSWPGARPDLARLCKQYGINLDKLERELAPVEPPEPAPKPARKARPAKKGRSS